MKPRIMVWTFLFAGSMIAKASAGTPVSNSSTRDTSYWQTQTTGVAGTLHAISAVDENVCWLAGDSGRIIRTVDGGNTWSLGNSGIIGTQRISVFEGVSDNIAFAATTPADSTYIFRTTDAGTSWQQVYSQPNGFIFGIKMYNSTEGLAVGDPVGGLWTVLKTTNGGDMWFRTASEPPQIGGASGGSRFNTFDTSYVWFFDNEGRQYWSTNRGETWPSISEPDSEPPLVCWNRSHNSLDPSALVVTRDQVFRYQFGWSVAGLSPNAPMQPTGLVGALWTNEYWLVQGPVYYTPNAASTWTNEPPHGLNKYVGLIDMVTLGSVVSAWATGAGDTLYHYRGNLTNVGEQSESLPLEFRLFQNYPNPFNPSTTLTFDIHHSTFIILKVFDILGREVATLVNERKEPGTHRVEFNAEGLAGGVYIYRMQAGAYSASNKMLLLR